jgi:hypothetical protein
MYLIPDVRTSQFVVIDGWGITISEYKLIAAVTSTCIQLYE